MKEIAAPEGVSMIARDLLQGLTHFNVTDRYTAAHALQHPWVTRLNKTSFPQTLG